MPTRHGANFSKKREDIAALQLPTEHHLAISVDAMDLKNRLMFSSSESWGLQQHPRLWHSRTGGGAVHSIKSRHYALRQATSLFDHLVREREQVRRDCEAEQQRR